MNFDIKYQRKVFYHEQNFIFFFSYNIVVTWMYIIFVTLNSMFSTSIGKNMQSWIL